MPILDFKGKQHIYAHHLTVSYRPLIPDFDRSVGREPESAAGEAAASDNGSPDGNLIIHGDNLHALKALLPRYAGRVKCVYIDPPYNTGNEKWVYNDNVNSPLMQEWFRVQKPVDGEDLERHDKWLCMMWPRLHLLKELLAEDGVIFVSIDDNEQHHLRMRMMDEVFGEQNLVANIIWHHRKSSQNDIDISLSHNHVVCYATNRSLFSFNAGDIEESRFSNPDNDPRGPWVADPMDAPNIRENLTYEIVNPNTGTVYLPPIGRCWRFSREKFDEALLDNRIMFGKTGTARPQYKRFLSEARERGTSIFTIWNDVGTATDGTRELMQVFGRGQPFSTPKPTDLIKKMVRVSTTVDDFVLDSFAGSGTTAQAVLELNKEDNGNRKFILVECEDYADSITAERVRRVIRGVPSAQGTSLKEGLGGSFTYCTLGPPIDVEGLLTGAALPDYGTLAAYLLHTATGISSGVLGLMPQNEDGLFYSGGHTDYYLLYEPDIEWLRSSEGVLNEGRVERIGELNAATGRSAVVFGVVKYMSQRDLTRQRITFCQLPYELHRGG